MPATPPPDAPEKACSAGLSYVTDESPGIRRRRCGRGFTYVLPDGGTLSDEDARDRIAALAIPPAWTDVWICPDPLGHLQATGRDEEDRKQYRYHPLWEEVRDASKFETVVQLGHALPRIRARVGRDLAATEATRTRILAAAVRLLDRTGVRIGTPVYAERNGSFGLTTLRRRHVRIRGSSLNFEFTGKGGNEVALVVEDRRLARVLRESVEAPGWEVFTFPGEGGRRTPVSPEDVNEYIREVGEDRFTAKDFRTWLATVTVVDDLAADAATAHQPEAALSRWLESVDRAAERLFNTRAVLRESYLPPGLQELFVSGGWTKDHARLAARAAKLRRPGHRTSEPLALALLEALLIPPGRSRTGP